MKTTSSFNFYCRQSKCNRKGLAPIEVSLIINSKRTFFNLPRKEEPADFERQLKKKSSDLNRYLAQITINLNKAQTELLMAGLPVTAEAIKHYIQNGGVLTYTLKDMFDEFMNIQRQRTGIEIAESTYRKYEIIRQEFFSVFNPEMEANSIDSMMIADYYAKMKKSKRLSTTAGKMAKLKSVFKFAFLNGKIKAMPFSGIRIKKESPKIEYLTKEELRLIMDRDFNCERIEKVKDLFLFQACTGLSYADINTLQPEDVQEHEGMYYIRKKRVKTGIEYTAVVLPLGMEIWRKHNGHLPKLSNQKYNVYVKEICDVVGIRKNVHSHLARKTYATLLLNSGVSLTSVSKMLGHSNTKITEKCYAKVLNETIFDEVRKVI